MCRFAQDGQNVDLGLLILDTPGHASFGNLRITGGRLADLACLVIDLLQGFQPTTLEAIDLLKKSRTPFIVAVNKIDRLYGWVPTRGAGFRDTFEKQNTAVNSEFNDRLNRIKLAFSEQGLNSELFDRNTSLARNVSLVPTSAVTGEGIPDLLFWLSKLARTRLNERLRWSDELNATVLDVKMTEGMGTTLDVILTNGTLREGDRIVLCGMDGPIATTIRALLSPQPLKELRVKVSQRSSVSVALTLMTCSHYISGIPKFALHWASKYLQLGLKARSLELAFTSHKTRMRS